MDLNHKKILITGGTSGLGLALARQLIAEGALSDNKPEDISKVIDINLKGVINCARVFIEKLTKKDEGILVNISSTSGVDNRPGQSVYSATKWGVRGFTECLREDFKGTGLKVIGIYPGGMKTNLFSAGGVPRDTSKYVNPKNITKDIINILKQDKSYFADTIVFRRTDA